MKEEVEWNGQKYVYEWQEGSDVEQFIPYTLVHSICFDERGYVLIQNEYGRWRFQGGGPEIGENYQETLIREMGEEVNIVPKNIYLLGAFKIKRSEISNQEYFYQLCVFCLLDRKLERKVDPEDGSIDEIIFIDPLEIDLYLDWGNHGKQMLASAIKYYSDNKSQNS